MNILLVAGEAAGSQLLRALLARKEHHVVAVLAEEDAAPSSVWATARQQGLPVWPASLVRSPDLAATIAAERVDLLLNVHSLHIIGPEILAAPRIGAFNLHPGPLPRYAGLNGPSWAVYRRERSYGVTVHWMDAGIDTGEIAYQSLFEIGEADTGLTVATRCARLGLPLMLELVETAARDPAAIPRRRPDPALREYLGRGQVPNGGWIAWQGSARAVAAFVRACDYHPFPSPWGQARTLLAGREVSVLKAAPTGELAAAAPGTVEQVADGAAIIACADGAVRVSHLLRDGQRLRAAELLAPGQRLESRQHVA